MLLCEDDGYNILELTFPFKWLANTLSAIGENLENKHKNRTDLYSAHTDPAEGKVKRAIYINYQNIYITETKASLRLSFKRWQWWEDTWV